MVRVFFAGCPAVQVLAGLDGELNPFGDFSYVPPPLAVGPPGFGDCSNPGSEPPSGYATPIAHPTSPRDSPILVNQACGGAGAGGSVSPTPIRSSSDMMARYGNFDIILGTTSRIPGLCATPLAPHGALYLLQQGPRRSVC